MRFISKCAGSSNFWEKMEMEKYFSPKKRFFFFFERGTKKTNAKQITSKIVEHVIDEQWQMAKTTIKDKLLSHPLL